MPRPVAWAASVTKSAREVALARTAGKAGIARQRRVRFRADASRPEGARDEGNVCGARLPVGRVAARKHY